MHPPLGSNRKHYSREDNENQIVSMTTATVNNYSSSIGFNVLTSDKNLIEKCLSGLISKFDTESHGTWLWVKEIDNIKTALLKLKEANLITERYYEKVAKFFPKPGGGTIDITSQNLFSDNAYLELNKEIFSKPKNISISIDFDTPQNRNGKGFST